MLLETGIHMKDDKFSSKRLPGSVHWIFYRVKNMKKITLLKGWPSRALWPLKGRIKHHSCHCELQEASTSDSQKMQRKDRGMKVTGSLMVY